MGFRINKLSPNVKIAFGSVPKDGGTFTFYRNLRSVLLERGIDLRCISVGNKEAQLWDDNFADDGCELLAERESNIKKQAQVFVSWCEKHEVDIVCGVNSVAILSALPHLPENIRIISRCANAFDHGYRITVSCYERLSRIVALAPRQVEDLVNDYFVDRNRIVLIPNGTSVERFESASNCPRGVSSKIRLGYLGRLEHSQKGVLYLPLILERLRENGTEFMLTIAGKGVHEATLRRRLDSFIQSGEVRFIGALRPQEISNFLSCIDLFVFPSHFEGSPNALIEAMMAGCVPAAWRLDGITDFLIQDGTSGLLATMGDCKKMADKISILEKDRSQMEVMSGQVSQVAENRFSLARVANDYTKLVNQVMDEPPMICKLRAWEDFQIESAFRQPLWRRLFPSRVKKIIKQALFRMHLGDRFEY